MKYCVIKNTTEILEASTQADDIILQNATNVGFSHIDIEVLTEEEYSARLKTQPKLPLEPSLSEKNRSDIVYLSVMTGVDL